MQENVRRQADLLARCRVNDRWETGSGQLTCDVDKSAYSVVYNYDNTSISNKGNSMLRKIMPGQYGKKTWINTNAKAKKVKHECILLCKHTRMLREANSQRGKRENNSKPVEGLGVSSRRKHLCRRERKWRDDSLKYREATVTPWSTCSYEGRRTQAIRPHNHVYFTQRQWSATPTEKASGAVGLTVPGQAVQEGFFVVASF